jgi:hypothetical protein
MKKIACVLLFLSACTPHIDQNKDLVKRPLTNNLLNEDVYVKQAYINEQIVVVATEETEIQPLLSEKVAINSQVGFDPNCVGLC